MSMLSAQCDELRSMAASVGLEVPQAATLMMEAADTICELRERVAELEELTDGKRYIPQEWYQLVTTENARLRELAENLLMAFVVLETPKEQQKCIDRAVELRHELNVLPMETFDAGELGVDG